MTAEEKRMAEARAGKVAKLIQQYGEYQLQNRASEGNDER